MRFTHRRWPVAGVIGLAIAAVLGASAATVAPAAAKVSVIGAVDSRVGTDRAVTVTLRCQQAARCTGTVTVRLKGMAAKSAPYALKRGATKVVAVRLGVAQYKKVLATPRAAVVTVKTKGRAVATRSVTVRAAVPVLRPRATEITVGADHIAEVPLTCASASACTATAALRIAGAVGGTRTVKLAARASGTVRFPLTSAQIDAIGMDGAWVGGQVVITEQRPERLAAVRNALYLRMEHDGGHGHTDPEASHAYGNNWKPTEYDTCTTAEHTSYSAIGPDGKLYPAWHPAVHVRDDGSTCTFGHEHGDDPSDSDLYEWVQEQFRTENSDAKGLAFGYGSERLTEYTNLNGGGVHRHEDDPGHKVVVSNDQEMGVSFTDRYGDTEPLVCDYLVKAHQGSHSGDATKNNTHEMFFAMGCNDGTKMQTYLMSNYGNANELLSSCTRPFTAGHPAATAVETVGSILPDGEGGARLIPTADCIQQYLRTGSENGTDTLDDRRGSPAASSNSWWWAGYEQWQSFNSITDTEGNELARFEPWFGLQNPSRYYLGNGATDTQVGYLNDLAWESGNQKAWTPWRQQAADSAEKIDRKSPKAWFNGAIRDAWITTTKVDNAGAESAVVYTDPWGKNAQSTPFPASIRTYISRTDNTEYVTRTTPSVTNRSSRQYEALRRKGVSAPTTLGFFYDYGTDAQGNSLGVHAPN